MLLTNIILGFAAVATAASFNGTHHSKKPGHLVIRKSNDTIHHVGKHGHLAVRKLNDTIHHVGKHGHLAVRKLNDTIHHVGKHGHLAVRKLNSTGHHGHHLAARKANSTVHRTHHFFVRKVNSTRSRHHFAIRDDAPTSTTILLSTVYVSPVPLSTGVEDYPVIMSTAASAPAADTTGSPSSGDDDAYPVLYSNSTSSVFAPSSVVADPILVATGTVLLSTDTAAPTTLSTSVASGSYYPSATTHGKKGPRPTKPVSKFSGSPEISAKWFEELKKYKGHKGKAE